MGMFAKTTGWARKATAFAKARLSAPFDAGSASTPQLTGGGYQLPGTVQEQQRGAGKFGRRRLSFEFIQYLAEIDLDTLAIIDAWVGFITSATYRIEPRLEDQMNELARWSKMELANMQPKSPDADGGEGKEPTRIEFESDVLDQAAQKLCRPKVEAIAQAVQDATLAVDAAVRRMDVVFNQGRALLEQKALDHCRQVDHVFRHPNDEVGNWQGFIRPIVLDAVTLGSTFIGTGKRTAPDSGHLEEFLSTGKKGLAEMWWVPADEVTVLRTKVTNRQPEPPEPAWVRKDGERIIGKYDREHMVNILRHPCKDGYSLSAVESIVGSVIGTSKVSSLNIDEIKAAYMSSGILSFGAHMGGDDLARNKAFLMQSMYGAVPGAIATTSGGSDKTEFWRMGMPPKREASFMEYRHALLDEKCRAFGLSAGDIGFIAEYRQQGATETQWDISKVRAIHNFLIFLQDVFNEEIIWKFWPYQDVQFAFDALKAEQFDEQKQKWEEWAVKEGVVSRAWVAEQHNVPTSPGQEVLTKDTGAGVLVIAKVEQYEQTVRVAGQQFPQEQQGQQGQQPGGGQPEQTPGLMTPGTEESAPGTPMGMQGETLYPELANPFAVQQMVHGIDDLRKVQEKRLSEIVEALDLGDTERAKAKAGLAGKHLNRDAAQVAAKGGHGGSAVSDMMAMVAELQATAAEAVSQTGG